jgi:hypothetical protein
VVCPDQRHFDLAGFNLVLNQEAQLDRWALLDGDLCLVERAGLVHAGAHRQGFDALCPLFLAASGIHRRYGVGVNTLRVTPTPAWLAQCGSPGHVGVLHAAIDGLGHLLPLSLVTGGVTVSAAAPPRAAEYDAAVVLWPDLVYRDEFLMTGITTFVSLRPFGGRAVSGE